MRNITKIKTEAGTVEVSITVNDRPQRLYRRYPDGRLFMAGTPGARYAIKVHNLTAGRIEVLASVDGRDIHADGPLYLDQPEKSTGFIIGGHGTHSFRGFRLDDEREAEFVFGDPERTSDTIAVQATGSTANLGVIGVAVYHENVMHSHTPPYGYGSEYGDYNVRGGLPGETAKGFDLGATRGGTRGYTPASAPQRGDIGTEMGQTIGSVVRRTSFSRNANHEVDLVEIGYATEASLRQRGIIPPADEPQAFVFPDASTGYERYRTAPTS